MNKSMHLIGHSHVYVIMMYGLENVKNAHYLRPRYKIQSIMNHNNSPSSFCAIVGRNSRTKTTSHFVKAPANNAEI